MGRPDQGRRPQHGLSYVGAALVAALGAAGGHKGRPYKESYE